MSMTANASSNREMAELSLDNAMLLIRRFTFSLRNRVGRRTRRHGRRLNRLEVFLVPVTFARAMR
jgi:hypothetical protein